MRHTSDAGHSRTRVVSFTFLKFEFYVCQNCNSNLLFTASCLSLLALLLCSYLTNNNFVPTYHNHKMEPKGGEVVVKLCEVELLDWEAW